MSCPPLPIPGLTISGESASVVTGAQETAPSTLLLAPSLSTIHRREGLMSGDTRGEYVKCEMCREDIF